MLILDQLKAQFIGLLEQRKIAFKTHLAKVCVSSANILVTGFVSPTDWGADTSNQISAPGSAKRLVSWIVTRIGSISR
tara:strand:- start:111 stop:344 length:234 start_codon:yes stop_codon:yes gene_type:complete